MPALNLSSPESRKHTHLLFIYCHRPRAGRRRLPRQAQLVINGILADPTEGPDSALYEAMGYTRKSERRSGLTRKRNQTPTE